MAVGGNEASCWCPSAGSSSRSRCANRIPILTNTNKIYFVSPVIRSSQNSPSLWPYSAVTYDTKEFKNTREYSKLK
ncbi:hypothetical protein L596_000157 [Steinernema carpocapsae]|uniref:Uncharacterized protein n=1 Tax=Steinernema carpocapsae TaxID=34508 RepID=A0A4U8UHV3_STECR|nr:hypothetical protein L596_000157 [Steinernema carpocapsae]